MNYQHLTEAEVNNHVETLYSCWSENQDGRASNGGFLPTWKELANDPTKQKQANAWRHLTDYAAGYFYTG